MENNVNHPTHYNSGKIEVIDFIEDQKLNFSLGNAIKYTCRAGRKMNQSVLQDLGKAAWYIIREMYRIVEQDVHDKDKELLYQYNNLQNEINEIRKFYDYDERNPQI